MSTETAIIHIIGAPIACAEGVKDTWREVAGWAAVQLYNRFGTAVHVQYFDLFDPDCPILPQDVQLPLVLVNGQVLASGGKISVPVIRRHLESQGWPADAPKS
jgi:hypothetical protein